MAKRKPKDLRPRCRGCATPFTPSVSQEFCRLCDEDREQAARKLSDLKSDLAFMQHERDRALEGIDSRQRRELDEALVEIQGLRLQLARAGQDANTDRKVKELQARVSLLEGQLTLADMRIKAMQAFGPQLNGQRPTSIPDDVLNSLIRLAHPDKHGGSQSANKVTAWLLEQRKRRA